MFDCPNYVRLAREVNPNEDAAAASLSHEIKRFLALRLASANGGDRGSGTRKATAVARPMPEVPPVTKSLLFRFCIFIGKACKNSLFR